MKKSIETLRKQIVAAKVRIGKERDKLRSLIDDLEELDCDTAEAIDDLESAADALSRLT